MVAGRYIRITGAACLPGLIWIAGLAIVGCGVDPAPPPSSDSTFDRLQSQVFDVSCSSDSCHGSRRNAGNLVLEPGKSWEALVDHLPSNPAAAARGWMRVSAGNPGESFLLTKLASGLAIDEGRSMPYAGAPLSEATLAVFRAWIAAGAPRQGRVPGDDGRPLGGSPLGAVTLNPPARGVQLSVTSRPIPEGTEETLCHTLKLASDVDLDVNKIEIAVAGGSHHIHLYRPYQPIDLPDGFEPCNAAVDFDRWELIVATQLRQSDWQLPSRVAFGFRAREQLMVQAHFVNVGSLETLGDGKVTVNLHAAEPGSTIDYAGSIFGQNKDVMVPARSVVSMAAECTFPHPITLMAETGHYHFRGRQFQTYRWNNGVRGEQIYGSDGYDEPNFLVHGLLAMPYFLAGQGLQWSCTWENPGDRDLPFGPYTDANEHCNWFGFYYPARSRNEAITCVRQGGVSITTMRQTQ